MKDENVIDFRLPKQLFLFVAADDDAGIFLDSRDVPPSSRSVSSTDDLLPGTSRCTPSDIVYRRLRACDCFRRCPLPFLPNWTLLYNPPRRRDPPSSFPALAGKNCNKLN